MSDDQEAAFSERSRRLFGFDPAADDPPPFHLLRPLIMLTMARTTAF